MAITKNDIHATADNIVAEGGSPTLAAIRKVLGGGSFTTISEAMKEWKAQHQAQTATAPIREAAPASVSDRLNVFGSEIWAIALEMANARLQSEREALELVRQELEETQAEAIDLADQLTIEIEQAQATIQQQQDALAKHEEAALESNARLESEMVARHEAERKCELIEAAMVEVRHQAAEQNAEIEQLRAKLETQSTARIAADQQAAVLSAKLESMTERATKAETRVEQIEKQSQQNAQELNNARNQVQAQQIALDTATREIDDVRKQIKDVQNEAKKATEEAAELRGQLTALNAPKRAKTTVGQ